MGIIKDGSIVRVDNIEALKGDNYKRFTIDVNDTTGFELNGVSDLKIEGDGVNFLFKGDVNEVISLLATKKVNNLVIEEPTLEEIFMHYYQ